MAVFDLTIKVSEMSPFVDKDLNSLLTIVNVKGKNRALMEYIFEVDLFGNNPREIQESYDGLYSKLKEKYYVTNIEISRDFLETASRYNAEKSRHLWEKD